MSVKQKRIVLRCGIIADVQYADVPDGTDFSGQVPRRFRHAKTVLERAVQKWKDVEKEKGEQMGTDEKIWDPDISPVPAFPVSLILQLGDFIDGRCRVNGGSDQALKDLLEVVFPASEHLQWDMVNLIGNHELYNYNRSELLQRLNTCPCQSSHSKDMLKHSTSNDNGGENSGAPREYYSFSPVAGWWFIVLDPYDISMIEPACHCGDKALEKAKQEAIKLIKAHNPNDVESHADWKAGLTGVDRRWLPYNGAMSNEQMVWLKATLDRIAKLPVVKETGAPQRAIVLSHVGLMPGAQEDFCLLWNYDAVLGVLRPFLEAQVVAAVLCGHDHRGGIVTPTSSPHEVSKAATPIVGQKGKEQCMMNEKAPSAFDEAISEGNSTYGALFITFPAPLEVPQEDDDAYATLDLHDDGSFVLRAFGPKRVWNQTLPERFAEWPPPPITVVKTQDD